MGGVFEVTVHRVAAALLAGGLALTVSGCSGSSGGGSGASGTPTAAPTSAAPANPEALPAGFRTLKGESYQFGLPATVPFLKDSSVVTADGGLETRWRYAIEPNGPFCVVVAVEQAEFDGEFPASVVALFASNSQPDQKTLRNQEMSPAPAGTVGGVDQESTFTGKLDDGTTFPSHLYQRKYLTPGGSLIALTVAGPQAQAEQCRLPEIIKSFSASGKEFTGATPAPTQPGPSASSTGGAA